MRVIIAGSRSICDVARVLDLVDGAGLEITEVISGCATGVDSCALMKPWAAVVRKMPAYWADFGRSAGYRRNAEMAAYADALIAIWDGRSRGTGHIISLMASLQKPHVVIRV